MNYDSFNKRKHIILLSDMLLLFSQKKKKWHVIFLLQKIKNIYMSLSYKSLFGHSSWHLCLCGLLKLIAWLKIWLSKLNRYFPYQEIWLSLICLMWQWPILKFDNFQVEDGSLQENPNPHIWPISTLRDHHSPPIW